MAIPASYNATQPSAIDLFIAEARAFAFVECMTMCQFHMVPIYSYRSDMEHSLATGNVVER